MSRSMLLLPLALSLPACYIGPVLKVEDPEGRTCDANFLEWDGGLTHYVMQGRGDGAFDFEPEARHVDRIEGAYDLETGAFHWTTTYAEGGHRVEDVAEGSGTLWRDGDMEIGYELRARYADGSERTWQVHTERYGCVELTRSEDSDQRLEIVESTWADDEVTWVREWIWGPLAITGEGSRNTLGEASEEGGGKKDDLEFSYAQSSDINGRTNQVFEGYDGVRHLKGSWSRTRDGVVEMEYTSQVGREEPQSWSYVVDGEGSGKGTWAWHDATCELRFEGFRCKRRACNEEVLDGDCKPPVDFPVL